MLNFRDSIFVEIVSSDSEDDELQRAISFSLQSGQETKQPKTNNDFASPQNSFFMNFLNGYSTEANKKTVKITDLITVFRFKLIKYL